MGKRYIGLGVFFKHEVFYFKLRRGIKEIALTF